MRFIIAPLLALPRSLKRAMAVFVDISLCALTVWLAYYLRLGELVTMNSRPLIAIILSVTIAIPTFAAFGLYRIVFRHAGIDAITSSGMACIVYAVGYAALITAYGFEQVPRTLGLIQPVLLFLAIAASRLAASYVLTHSYQTSRRHFQKGRVLVYGAGSAGRQLAKVMANSGEMGVLGFLDDDQSIHFSRIQGLPVFPPRELKAYVRKLEISEVLLALPSASRARRNEIIDDLTVLGLTVRTLPRLVDIAHGTVKASDLREVTINDLLQRDPVSYDSTPLNDHVTDKVILVTGAGGSIGSELCRQIIILKPSKLLLVEMNEYALYSILNELNKLGEERLVPLLASAADQARMDIILRTWKPDMIFHAAAYKHVPLVEHNPLEGLRNNVHGTRVIAELAAHHNVRDFVLVSTDKAVRPTNIMGASKRLAELTLQGLNCAADKQGTCFSMVRFGNVLGSSGSVVPLFTRQIKKGGPITITHKDITRYFMTIPEAANLVLHAGAMAEGGEVFVLDMGEPIKILDLAKDMVRLSGLSVRDASCPDGDIEIQVVGMRPGEKLYEELLIGNNPMKTNHPRIMKATEHCLPWTDLRPKLERLNELILANDVVSALNLLREMVTEFTPASDIVDLVELAVSEARSDHSAGVGQSAANRV